MFEVTRYEYMQFVFQIDESEFVFNGTEPTKCNVKLRHENGGPVENSPVLINLTSVYTSGTEKPFFTFSGDSSVLTPGFYTADAWIFTASKWQLLGDFDFRVVQNVSEFV